MKSLMALATLLLVSSCGDSDTVTAAPRPGRVADDSVGWDRELAEAGEGEGWWDDAGVFRRDAGPPLSVDVDAQVPDSAVDASDEGAPDAGGEDLPEPSCDRRCLQNLLTDTLNALVGHAPDDLPLSEDAVYIEGGRPTPFGTGVWESLSTLGRYRQDVIDPVEQVAGAHAVVEEAGQPALLALRLQLTGEFIGSIELQLTRSAAEGGGVFEPGSLKVPNAITNAILEDEQRADRATLVAMGESYAAGLRAGSFSTTGVPFADSAFKVDNGRITAGLGCTSSAPACTPPQDQELTARPMLEERVLAVDEQTGLTWMELDLGPGSGQAESEQLRVLAIVKVLDGQIRAIEAFQKSLGGV